MNVGRLAVTRPVAVTMRIAALVLLGFILFLRIPIDLLPKVDIPIVNVNISWPNTSPEVMEVQIARPVEQAVNTIKGLSMVSSNSGQGFTSIRCQFDYGVDVDNAAVDVFQQVQRAQRAFPRDPNISAPTIFKFDPSTTPILLFSVTSERSDLVTLRKRLINEISPLLESAGGVASVSIGGGQDRAIMIDVDPAKLDARGLTISQVAQRIEQENLTQPAGIVKEGKSQYNLRSVGFFRSVEEIRNLPLRSSNGQQVSLREVATVRDESQDITNFIRANGDPAISIGITRQNSANTVEVAKRVKEAIGKIESRFPDLKFQIAYDQSSFIQKSINDLEETAIIGAVLAILIITFFLRNLKSTFVVALSIPISMISTFSLLYFFGFTLNTISLSGLALASGLIVDDAIVVLENIYRHIERDRSSAAEAAETGTNEILTAVLASTFTVMIVFLPLILLSGQTGQVFTQFALVVIFSIAISLLDATTVVPMLASRMISTQEVLEESHPELRDPAKKNRLNYRVMDGVGRFLTRLDSGYRNALGWALSRRSFIVGVGVVSTLLAFVLWPLVPRELLPPSDSGNIDLRLKLPVGTQVEKTNEVMLKIEKVLLEDKVVETVIAGAGANVGLRGAGGGAPQEGSATIKLRDDRKEKTAAVIKRLQKEFSSIPGARVQMNILDVVQRILGNNSGISIDVYGQDLEELTESAKKVMAAMSDVPGLQNVDMNVQDALPEVQWQIDREKAQSLGITFSTVADVIAAATNGRQATFYQENGFQYPIFVQVPQSLRNSTDEIKQLVVSPRVGSVAGVTLGQIATPVFGIGPNQIARQKGQRIITVSGNVLDRPIGDVQKEVETALSKVDLPPTTSWELGFQQQSQQAEYAGLGLSVFLAVALIYMLLASQFESFVYPLVVLVSVPLCGIGLVLGLFFTDRSFGLTGFIGLLMLVGIVVKNGILLVDYTNQLRASGRSRLDALLTAGQTRLRPILMTTLCAVFGMLPLALGIGSGSEMYVPLATVVIGGLITSTALTLLVVPVVYSLFDDLQSKFSSKK
jgi:hydrophobic/amphiphilic exporter-1 (mainly G- bacteria), HAE1 family